VTKLLLPSNNIVGNLPGLSSLQHLIHLDLSNPSSSEVSNDYGNSVGGTLDALCGLGNLSTVLLSGNKLTGSIPVCVHSLANTIVLDLNYNSVQGTTPDELCYLHDMEELHLRGNHLHGTVPVCFGEDLPALRILDYSNLHRDYSFGNQSLSGTLPASLCNLERLETLEFQATQGLRGTLPDCLGAKQSQLQTLDLKVNQLHGPIPENLCQAGALEVINLYENALTGTLRSCSGSLSQLTVLDLDVNQLHGPIPKELCQANTLESLKLFKNSLTGTLPSCLGNLSHLNELDLGQNNFHGPMPMELCQASALELLLINDNALTGSLPSCLTTSFLLLEAMLLYNNDLSGTVPSQWASPSLRSIMLSNNPKLSGSLPESLFLRQATSSATQNSTSPNDVLQAVVIEGTLVGGTLPTALCSAQHLETLAVSGNELTGSLPDCVTSLRNLRTLRASQNHLTGSLPAAINNMTSLTVLDLSVNMIQGRVPAGLGDISQNLDIVQLQFNRLSCDLPASVLDWHASSADVTVDLFENNLFGCNTNTIYALSIQGAQGLRNANEQAFDAYICGNSNYVLPVITVAILVAPIAIWLGVLYCRSRLALQWRVTAEWVISSSTLFNELDHADRQMRMLALGVIAAATLAGTVALVLSLNVAESSFECEYMATTTLANKQGSNMRVLSIGVGAGACMGLMLGLTPWWHRLVTEWSSSTTAYSETAVEKYRSFLHLLEENAEACNFDAERIAEASPVKPASSSFEAIVRMLTLMVLILALVVLTIAPNVGYVFVVVSQQLTQQQKLASEMAVILAKTAIIQVLVPRVARKVVDLLVLNGALTFARFRLRMTVAVALSMMSMIVLPSLSQLLSDPRCLYYHVSEPPLAVNTAVSISTCGYRDFSSGQCLEYSTLSAISTYTPRFTHESGVCTSAIFSVYGPVFLGVVLLAATLPAGMETIIVPWLAPWCYWNADSSVVARTGLRFLQTVTWNVWPTLADAGLLPPNFSLGAAKLDYLAQRVVERDFVQLMATLIVALTFGSGIPVVSGACAVAACVQLLHHRHVLGQIVRLGRLEQPAVVPNLMGCTDVPVGSAVVVVVTVILCCMWASYNYLEPAVVVCTIITGLCVGMAACGSVAYWLRHHRKGPQHSDRAQSTAALDTSQEMLMETLLSEAKTTGEARSS